MGSRRRPTLTRENVGKTTRFRNSWEFENFRVVPSRSKLKSSASSKYKPKSVFVFGIFQGRICCRFRTVRNRAVFSVGVGRGVHCLGEICQALALDKSSQTYHRPVPARSQKTFKTEARGDEPIAQNYRYFEDNVAHNVFLQTFAGKSLCPLTRHMHF